MKRFDEFDFDHDRCREELQAFRRLLDEVVDLRERAHVLPFFARNRNLASLLAYVSPDVARVDRIAHEFDVFGDFAADLVLGDFRKREYVFVEFEGGGSDDLFKTAGTRHSREWSRGFDRGYGQIIDWFWKLHDLSRSEAAWDRFGRGGSFNYSGLLVVGRDRGLKAGEFERLQWRRQRVVVDSRRIHCLTYDELYDDLAFRMSRYRSAGDEELEAERLSSAGAAMPELPPTRRRKDR